MPSIVVRNLSQEALDALRRRAQANRRSTEAEAREVLETAGRFACTDPVEAAERIRKRIQERAGILSDSTEIIREARDSR